MIMFNIYVAQIYMCISYIYNPGQKSWDTTIFLNKFCCLYLSDPTLPPPKCEKRNAKNNNNYYSMCLISRIFLLVDLPANN